jgi:hypothetical protein
MTARAFCSGDIDGLCAACGALIGGPVGAAIGGAVGGAGASVCSDLVSK